MKAKLLIPVVIILTAAAACNKSGYTTAPQLTFKSVSATQVSQNDLITFSLNYTDKEGDIQSHLYVQRVTSNCKNDRFVELDSIPSTVPKQSYSKGEIDLTYAYNAVIYDINGNRYDALPPSLCSAVSRQNDTCVFRFVLTDAAHHSSDTVSSPVIVFKN